MSGKQLFCLDLTI